MPAEMRAEFFMHQFVGALAEEMQVVVRDRGQKRVRVVNLGELAETTADQISLLAEDKQISISCQCHPGVMVRGDRARLKQVLVNLLDNAIKYTPSGGAVKVNVASRDHKAVLEVQDNGIGIPGELKDKIFTLTPESSRPGTAGEESYGLGLSISQKIIEEHDGKIWFESAQGEGSVFYVELPSSN